MKLSLSCLLFFLLSSLTAQISPPVEVEVLTKPTGADPRLKMECDPSSTLMFNFVELEGSTPGNNDADDGAFMRWEATGSSTGLYYNQILSTTRDFSTQIVRTNSGGRSVFDGGANNTSNINVIFGGNSTNSCTSIIIDTYIIRVWEVKDDDGNGLPDRDANGDIIGCYIESEPLRYEPTCPPNDPARLGAVVVQPDCNNGGSGSITLNLATDDFYCVGADQGGENVIEWTGPNVDGSSSTSLTNLEAGDYTVVVTDFYGCVTSQTFTIAATAEVQIECPASGLYEAPSAAGAADGTADITLSGGSGDYTLSWDGGVPAQVSATDGVFPVSGLDGPGPITFLVTDNVTGCTAECTLDPPCVAEFELEYDETTGQVYLFIINGFPGYTITYTGPDGNLITVTTDGDNSDIFFDPFFFDPGSYRFELTENDNIFCGFFEDIDVPGPNCDDLVIETVNVQNPGCDGNDGTISVNILTNDIASYFWDGPGLNDPQTTTLTGLSAGTYLLTANDTRGCQKTETFVLEV